MLFQYIKSLGKAQMLGNQLQLKNGEKPSEITGKNGNSQYHTKSLAS